LNLAFELEQRGYLRAAEPGRTDHDHFDGFRNGTNPHAPSDPVVALTMNTSQLHDMEYWRERVGGGGPNQR
jgi:hypothetical protein